jgi:aromatic ring-opening dioxygenase catalytic subunit (LigB family)
MQATPTRMPVVFIGHGAPSFLLDKPITHPVMVEFSKGSENYKALLRTPKEMQAEKPAAIIIISAHWDGYEYIL